MREDIAMHKLFCFLGQQIYLATSEMYAGVKEVETNLKNLNSIAVQTQNYFVSTSKTSVGWVNYT